ncbi:hypothetical protein PT282_06450 [Bifidobacterium sp. ESL0763]|uniref:hypothetical protein n=1 Tax=Bifidobacterium sp. ESL0763 TaxID=2983227 RepID=UPI0023F9BAA6|nr:hypothetical protein [Bifidobacterium sp. ESL0763]MDF7664300.1 hypothetical protein [Bifidobacterium sp. ESL0763]
MKSAADYSAADPASFPARETRRRRYSILQITNIRQPARIAASQSGSTLDTIASNTIAASQRSPEPPGSLFCLNPIGDSFYFFSSQPYGLGRSRARFGFSGSGIPRRVRAAISKLSEIAKTTKQKAPEMMKIGDFFRIFED